MHENRKLGIFADVLSGRARNITIKKIFTEVYYDYKMQALSMHKIMTLRYDII